MKHYIMLLLALLVALNAMGQRNKVFIADFEVSPDSTVTVPVILANQDTTYGVQFNVYPPDGLKVKSVKTTPYSDKLGMDATSSKREGARVVLLYSMSMKSYPPDSAAVAEVTFRATPQFRGGNVVIKRVYGSRSDNSSLTMDGCTTHVTLPDSVLFGLPEEDSKEGSSFFTLPVGP